MPMVRVWLQREIENNMADFKHVKGVLPGKEFFGIKVEKDGSGRWCANSFGLGDTLPDVLLPYITGVSFHRTMSITRTPKRERGLYTDEDAETTAVLEISPDINCYDIRVIGKGKTIKKVADLYYKIVSGEIRPYKSFTGEQLGLSKQELEEKVEQLESKCRSYAFFEDFFNVVKEVWLDDDKRWFLNGRAFRKQLGELIAIRPEK